MVWVGILLFDAREDFQVDFAFVFLGFPVMPLLSLLRGMISQVLGNFEMISHSPGRP